MDDVIYRQAVVYEMEEYWRSLNLRRKRIPLAAEAVYMDLKGVVFTLPSAQPERKRGRWIAYEDEDGEHYGDKCSECGEWYVMPYGKTNFCPNCGADMRGEDNAHDL